MQPASVFIIDDEAMVADDLKKTSIRLGYAVAGTAKTGESAREKIAETKSDLVWTSISREPWMPSRLQERSISPNLPAYPIPVSTKHQGVCLFFG